MSLNQRIDEFLMERGALKVGFATTTTLAGGPPSADLTYKLEGARSAISFALPLNCDRIRPFLAKKERLPHEEDNLATNMLSMALSWELAEMIRQEGYEAKGRPANLKYRTEIPDWQISLPPDISHRYMAVRSGVGSYGWSGNVGIKGHGTAVILGTCITTAELEPTDPVPEDEQFCDNCRMCVSACAVGMFERDKETSVTLGGVTFSHAARRTYLLCQFCCGGITGLHESGKWSAWSPGRFTVAEGEKELFGQILNGTRLYAKRPPMPGGYDHPALAGAKQYLTCGNCQLICWSDKKETAENLKLLHTSGCVLQKPDGTLYALPPDEAEKEFMQMEPDHKALYC